MILHLVVSALVLTQQSTNTDSITSRLQAIADSIVRTRPRIPGALISVESTKLQRRWAVAAGESDTARKRPLSAEQPVRIASVTKTYTAAAVLRLVERGVVALSDPISKHLPRELTTELERDGLRTDSITVEHLLSHRAGLAEHPSVPSYIPVVLANPAKRWTRLEQVQWMVDSLQPVGAPGNQLRYSDTGYILLGAIIERHTEKNLGAGVRELLRFEQLGLRQTWFETLEPAPPGVADRVHQYMNGVDTYHHDPSLDLYGGGGVVAPLADVSTFFTALLAGRVFDKPATLQRMLVMHPGFMDGYGLGIFRVDAAGQPSYGHSGFWGVLVVHVPSDELTVAVAVNEQSQARSVFGMLAAVVRAVRPLLAGGG